MEAKEIVLCPTKAGKGFKIVVEGVWFYTSKNQLYQIFKGKGCSFRTIEEKPVAAVEGGEEDGM